MFVSRAHETGQMLCVTECGDERSDFYRRCKMLGLRGIQFDAVGEGGVPRGLETAPSVLVVPDIEATKGVPSMDPRF